MWETLEFYWWRILMISVFATFPFLALGTIQTVLLLRRNSRRLKRGIKLFSRPLTQEEREYLQNIDANVVTKRKQQFLTFLENIRGFILINNNERLIQFRKPRWGTSWPYVGYVNLAQPIPELEYRASLFMHLCLLPFIISGIALIFIVPFMYLNFRTETKAIDSYLQNQMGNSHELFDKPI